MPSEEVQRVVLAVDPGRAKCGVAVVAANGEALHRAVVPTYALPDTVVRLVGHFSPVALLVGNGTQAKVVNEQLDALGLAIPIHSVDERHTSEAARERYREEVQPKGLGKLVPKPLRTPDVPYDDFVAVILAERWWKSQAG